MTLKPQLPSLDAQVADLLRRMAIMEALSPANALVITDGSVTVDPTVEIDVDPTSLLLTDLGGGVAELSAGIPALWTPALHQSGGDPTGTFSTAGQYVRIGHLVFVTGDINFGSGFTNGTGVWTISLPFHSASLGGGSFGTSTLWGFGHDHQMFFHCSSNINAPTTDSFTLQYADAVPVGSRQTFDGTVWGATWNGDTLWFSGTYYTNDP